MQERIVLALVIVMRLRRNFKVQVTPFTEEATRHFEAGYQGSPLGAWILILSGRIALFPSRFLRHSSLI